MDTNTTTVASNKLAQAMFAVDTSLLEATTTLLHAYRVAKEEGNRKVMSDLIQAHDALNALRNSL